MIDADGRPECGHMIERGTGAGEDPLVHLHCTLPAGHPLPRTHHDADAAAVAAENGDRRLARRATWTCPATCDDYWHDVARVAELGQEAAR